MPLNHYGLKVHRLFLKRLKIVLVCHPEQSRGILYRKVQPRLINWTPQSVPLGVQIA